MGLWQSVCNKPRRSMPSRNMYFAQARNVFEVNYFGALFTTKTFLDTLRQFGPGARILQISSMVGVTTHPLSGLYMSAKHALEAVSAVLRTELYEVRVIVQG